MMRTVLLLFLLATAVSFGQNYEFGKVSKREVQMKTYKEDSLADAVYLHKGRQTYFEYDHPEGWLVVTETHLRIKILTKDGLDYGTIKQDLYRSGSTKQRITKIKGVTYNDQNGKVVSQKLKKNGIFENEVNENWKEASIAMPAVKEGSVVEIRYTVMSPFWKISDLVVQEDIPVVHYHAKISVPNMFKYKRLVKGNFPVSPKDYSENRNMTFSWEQDTNRALTQATKTSSALVEHFVNEYEFRYVDALREEAYVDNINNYRNSITYELSSTERSDGTKKEYSTTWEEVAKTIYKSKSFGDQLSKTRFFEPDLETIRSGVQGDIEKMNGVFDFVKNRMTWNSDYRLTSQDGIQKAYKEKLGNSADINLLLVAMLRKIGLKANPVLISTRQHGIPLFPTLDGFNHVIACVEINGEFNLMDATERLSVPNVLPPRILNWYGTLVKENGVSQQIPLYPEKLSQSNILMNITINDDGTMEGSTKSNYTDLEALTYRIYYKDHKTEKRIEDIVEAYQLSDASDLEVLDFNTPEKPVSDSFNFESDESVEVIGSDMYFSPMFFLRMETSPFTLDERNYPIDYKYPFRHRKIISIKIPDGYKVKSMPESINLGLPEGMGSFVYKASETQGTISVQVTFTMNNSVVPAFKYPTLKKFYSQRVQKENEKIVLTKI